MSGSRPDSELIKLIQSGIRAVQMEEYLAGLNTLSEVYSTTLDPRFIEGLSYLGLCVALVEKKHQAAVSLCQRAIETQFYDGAHYMNLARVYVAAGERKRAVETCEDGLKILPQHAGLQALRRELGIRAQPPVKFLPRDNAINQALGRARHARKDEEQSEPGEE